MYKKITLLLFITVFAVSPLLSAKAETLSMHLQGRILLQVEQHGEAWFVSPGNQKRHFLGRPADAFQVMRELGLGITNTDFTRFENTMPEKLLGKILIKVEDSGKAYYIYPVNKKPYFLGRPSDAFRVMRELGLGVTDLSLNEISEDDLSKARRMEQERIRNEEKNKLPNEEATTDNSIQEKISSSTDDKLENVATSTGNISTTSEEIVLPTGSASCEFLAEYYKKETISGVANYSETVNGIDFDWGIGSPEILGDYKDKFAIRYTGNCFFEGGTYEFTSSFNDGIEATLDDSWLAKSWKNRSVEASETKTLNINEGYHRVKIEYYDHLGDASLKLDWIKK